MVGPGGPDGSGSATGVVAGRVDGRSGAWIRGGTPAATSETNRARGVSPYFRTADSAATHFVQERKPGGGSPRANSSRTCGAQNKMRAAFGRGFRVIRDVMLHAHLFSATAKRDARARVLA